MTAYTPDTVKLVANPAGKYNVASYTPGLVTNADGSITLVMSVRKPLGVADANWLPVPAGPFNLMLRAYGPQGSVASGSYVPPGLMPVSLP